MQQKSLSRWSQVGDQNGFITVFPDGVDNAWNAGLCCADDTSIDDVAFVRDAIKALQADACIDPKRIYASGCSNGGGMSFKLACECRPRTCRTPGSSRDRRAVRATRCTG